MIRTVYLNTPVDTSGITNSYDQWRRLTSVIHSNITTTLTYNDANQLLTES